MKAKHKLKHATRTIQEMMCDQPGCKFRGKPAQQGVCHTVESVVLDIKKMEQHEARLRDELADIKKTHKGKRYADWLEAMYVCAMLNWASGLDDLVRLRRDNALLRLRLGRR